SLTIRKLMPLGTSTTALVLTLAFALRVTPAFAVHDEGIFQLDGDAKASTCSGNGTGISSFGDSIGCTGDDWDDLYTCTGGGSLGSTCTTAIPGVGNNATAIAALAIDPSPKSIFTGGGSKDEKDITQWAWVDGSVPDKDDLVEAFAALYSGASSHKIVYFGANRLAVNGDAQIGFWLLQKAVSLKSDGTFQEVLGNPAHHAVGDVLILINFVYGGGTSNILVFDVTIVNCDLNVHFS